jgi:hypothetical protein
VRDHAFAGGAVVLIAAIVAACIALVYDHEALGPREWDPRVAPLVDFVEEARGHDFVHPVHVEFLTPEEYRAHATEDSSDGPYIDTMLRVLRSLGLVGGDVDLSAEIDEINDSGTVAYYSPNTRRIYVRGTEMSASLRVTLVHELTHALQDQTFDLDFSRTTSDGEAFALRALAEGDAIRIHSEYYASLSESERAAVDRQSDEEVDSSKALNSDRAPIMLSFFGAPYDLGVPFVSLLADIDGELDAAFRAPPRSEENVFDPVTFLTGDLPLDVKAPSPPKGAQRNDLLGDEVGAVLWYLLIATHTDQQEAMTAVDGWGGDAFTVYEQDDRLCTAMVFRGDTARDADEMHAALTKVVSSLGASAPALGRDAGDVTLTVCDPGTSAKAPEIDASTIFAGPTIRSYLLGLVLEDPDVSYDQADCAVDDTMRTLDEATYIHVLMADERDARVDQVLSSLTTALDDC